MPEPAAPASSALVRAGAYGTRARSGADGKNSLNRIEPCRAWFEVSDLDAGLALPQCPDPVTCADVGGLDLGEVSLGVAGQTGGKHPLQADTAVAGVSFRKPSGAAALHAACALTAVTSPLLV